MFRWGGLKGVMSFQRCPPPLEALYVYGDKAGMIDSMSEHEPSVIKDIPVFLPEQLNEALHASVTIGVAKISGLISPHSIEATVDQVRCAADAESIPARNIIPRMTELLPIYNIFKSSIHANAGAIMVFDPLSQVAKSENDSEYSHVDTNSRYGLSVLIPLTGAVAVFAAADKKFLLYKDTFTNQAGRLPQYAGTYGVGDAMMIRQEIKMLDGTSVKLPQMQHAGAGSTRRDMVAMDIRTPHIWLPKIPSAA